MFVEVGKTIMFWSLAEAGYFYVYPSRGYQRHSGHES